ncbi:hypothetical protein DFJ58DRAFT_844393 [Suillus subalutaceus]|uniref:uncharacterized protein n=1 Tax=Suillus subalutaceus TaxID=48586 RepID=UPI001B864A5B|nr:uncharacterized protein DFJ58DRAFT_844393 [Suillus subalutaceus]KAG1843285.1 hypothetical protein DFJ58DRAFT_844393 [Suillus subalutaceus]
MGGLGTDGMEWSAEVRDGRSDEQGTVKTTLALLRETEATDPLRRSQPGWADMKYLKMLNQYNAMDARKHKKKSEADNDNHWIHKVRPSGDYYFRVKPNSEGSTVKGSNNDGVRCNACYKPRGKGYDVPMRWMDIEGRSWMIGDAGNASLYTVSAKSDIDRCNTGYCDLITETWVNLAALPSNYQDYRIHIVLKRASSFTGPTAIQTAGCREKCRRYYENRTNNTPSIISESNTKVLPDDSDENKVLAIVPSGIPTVYVEDVLRKYAMMLCTSVVGDIEILKDGLDCVKPYLIWAQQGQDKIFNMIGICDEWRTADEVSNFIGHLVAMLEDLYRLAVWGDLDEAYLLGETMYQKVLGLEAPGI